MAIIATSNGTKSYTPVEAGNYMARCYSMVHIGTRLENIQGTEKELNKVRLSFELPTETKEFKEGEGEQPYIVSKEYTLSMHEKSSLRKDLESWRGQVFTEAEAKSFDITKLLGVPCMLNIIHKQSKAGNPYAVISSISKMPKGFTCPDQINDSFEFSVAEFDMAKFATLPEFLQDAVKESKEYKAQQHPQHMEVVGSSMESEDDDTGLPF
ncbi:phage replication initiation protein, NGO0469 family [Rufibacter soli]